MDNWANPPKFDNELGVPIDRHYVPAFILDWLKVHVAACATCGQIDLWTAGPT